jgi:hypothetical protein
VRQTRTALKAGRRRGLGPSAARESSAVFAFLLVSACAFLLLEPWHGPTVLALSEEHGVDAADLPALVLIALAAAGWHGRAREFRTNSRWSRGGRLGAFLAIFLGALLVAGIFFPRIGRPLVPAGGGTFNANTEEVGGLRAERVGRWSHLGVTYDGTAVRLYVNGVEAASESASGPIRRTTDPLWIGGNRPYGEYFKGVVDEVRVYDRALSPAEVRAAMSTPISDHGGPVARGLVAAYGFGAGHGRSVTDDSGNGNTGTIRGASWTRAGHFGQGITFDGDGEVMRVRASASLDLDSAMTLTAWIKPSETQSGWRTVIARQTDAYTLMAGGGRQDAGRLTALDRLRFVAVILLIAGLGLASALGQAPWASGARRWYWPVALFVAGSLLDAAFMHGDTLIGPALVAVWFGTTSSNRAETASMCVLSAAFAAVTILSIAEPAALPLPQDDGGVVRAAGLGLLLATAGVLSARRSAAKGGRPGAIET